MTMQKRSVVIMVGLIFLMMPVAGLGQSTDGKHHGMMGEQQFGKMGGSTNKQDGVGMPYYGMMGACGMEGSMMGYGMGNMNHPMMGGTGMGMGMHGMGMFGTHDWSSKKMRTFLDETRDLRKRMQDLCFEYGEKKRDPQTTIGELQEMQEHLMDLRKQLWEKYDS
jgi:hypothetical protein